MNVTTKIKMDLCRPDMTLVVHAVQGDTNSRSLEIFLYAGITAWTIPEDIVIAVRYSKPDGTKGYYDAMPDGDSAWQIHDHVLTVKLVPQMLTKSGTVTVQIEMIQGTKTLSTFGFQIHVEGNAAAGYLKSENYVNWLQWIKNQSDEHAQLILEAAQTAASASQRANQAADNAAASASNANSASNQAAESARSAQSAATSAAAIRNETAAIAEEVSSIVAGNEAYTKQESDCRYSSAIIQTATGNTIAMPDRSAHPLLGMKVFGKTVQNGVPSPTAPIPLVNAGANGSITVTADSEESAKTILLSTPDGLAGIAVSFSGNYIDETGQQWICDEIDFDRGIYIQRIIAITFDGSEDELWVSESGTTIGNRYLTDIGYDVQHSGGTGVATQSMNTNFPIGANSSTWNLKNIYTIGKYYTVSDNTLFVSLNGTETLAEFREYLAIHPMTVYCVLRTPVESPLPQEVLAEYEILRAQSSLQTISNEDYAKIEVKYIADTKAYIDSKLAALSHFSY